MPENNKKFVIQKHSRGKDIHWDLMLEVADVLETYRLPVPPEKISNQAIEVVKIFDHPLKFLTYEGSVNKGAGSVKIADTGTYQTITQNGINIELQFAGKILHGNFILTLIEKDRWEITAAQQ